MRSNEPGSGKAGPAFPRSSQQEPEAKGTVRDTEGKRTGSKKELCWLFSCGSSTVWEPPIPLLRPLPTETP